MVDRRETAISPKSDSETSPDWSACVQVIDSEIQLLLPSTSNTSPGYWPPTRGPVGAVSSPQPSDPPASSTMVTPVLRQCPELGRAIRCERSPM